MDVPLPPSPAPTSAPSQNPPVPSATATATITVPCPQCHQPVAFDAYFCPNCGKRLNEPPLSTGVGAQILLYAFSIALPIICFIAVSKWQGVKYMRSDDPVAKQIGIIATVLMALSTIISFWLFFVWINQAVQSSISSVGNLSGL